MDMDSGWLWSPPCYASGSKGKTAAIVSLYDFS